METTPTTRNVDNRDVGFWHLLNPAPTFPKKAAPAKPLSFLFAANEIAFSEQTELLIVGKSDTNCLYGVYIYNKPPLWRINVWQNCLLASGTEIEKTFAQSKKVKL